MKEEQWHRQKKIKPSGWNVVKLSIKKQKLKNKKTEQNNPPKTKAKTIARISGKHLRLDTEELFHSTRLAIYNHVPMGYIYTFSNYQFHYL